MPNQVDEMFQEADDLHRQLYPDQYPPVTPDPNAPPDVPGPPPDPVEPVLPTEPAPVEPPPAEPAPAAPPVEGTPTEPAPAPATPPGEPVTPPAAPDPFEERYRVLKGKYDAEVPRLAAEVAALKAQIGTPQQPTVQPTPPSASPAPATSLTIKEILSGDTELTEALASFEEAYPDVADLLVKLTEKAATVTNKKVQDVVSAVNNQVQSVQEFQVESRTQRFWDVINQDIPDWQVIRDDPEFSTWLEEAEPYTGYPRAALMQDALSKFDAPRVVKFYKGFTFSKSSPPPVINPTPIPTPFPAVPGAALVAPPSGRSAAPSPAPPNNDPPITKAYIQQFYSEAARGTYEGREKEFNTIEARINAAVTKGNVVG